MQYDKTTEMSSDVERLLDGQESNDSNEPSTSSNQEKSGIWKYIYLYKMPHLTQDQLIGFSTKYKVNYIGTQ